MGNIMNSVHITQRIWVISVTVMARNSILRFVLRTIYNAGIM